MKPIRLGVNIDHIATLRQARREDFPDPVVAALIAEKAGALSIVCHLREDRRHIQDSDVFSLRRRIQTRLNLEMSAAPEIVKIACQVRPDQATLVPEKRQELTTEGGLDVKRLMRPLAKTVSALHKKKITVSLFIDPDFKQLKAAQALGVSIIELHTGGYAQARSRRRRLSELAALKETAQAGQSLGLGVAAGHGLDYGNVGLVAAIAEIEELNIGFSIIGHSLFTGIETAVSQMLCLMKAARK